MNTSVVILAKEMMPSHDIQVLTPVPWSQKYIKRGKGSKQFQVWYIPF